MSNLTVCLALGIFPLTFLLVLSFNPPALAWVIRLALQGRPFEPESRRPIAIREKAAAFRRYAYFLGDGIVVSLVAIIAAAHSISSSQLGLHLDNWSRNAAIGMAAGALRIVAQRLMLYRVSIDPEDPFTWAVRRGSLGLWTFIFVAGAFAEELWIALCLVVLAAAGHAATVSVTITIIVFAASHYQYGFWGAIAVGVVEIASPLLFLHYRSLVPLFFFHLVGNLGSIYWHRCWRR